MDCPELPEYDLSSEQPSASIFEHSPVLKFNQSWLHSPEEGFCSGEVRIGWRENMFCFDAKLVDKQIFTKASKRNEMLYLLGDTLEFFAGIENDPSYVEYHYAPNSVILQLLWPRPLATIDLKASGGVEAFAISEDCSKHRIQMLPDGWRVSGQVQLPQFRNSSSSLSGMSVDLHFGRYDYSAQDLKPVLSSTSPIPRASFHERDHWRKVVCRPRKA